MECEKLPDDGSWIRITRCEWKMKDWYDYDEFARELRKINEENREDEALEKVNNRSLFPNISDEDYNIVLNKVRIWELKASDALILLNWETIPDTIKIFDWSINQ